MNTPSRSAAASGARAVTALHCNCRAGSPPAKKRPGFPLVHCPIPGNSDLFRIASFGFRIFSSSALRGCLVVAVGLLLGRPAARAAGYTNTLSSCVADSGLPAKFTGQVWSSGSLTDYAFWFAATSVTMDGKCMHSPWLATSGSSSFINVAITNATAVSFYWRLYSGASSQLGYVVNQGATNQVSGLLAAAAGDSGWKKTRVQLPAGTTNTIRWTFTAGSSPGADYALLDGVCFDFGAPVATNVQNALNSVYGAKLPYQTVGAPWVLGSCQGYYGARSGAIGNNQFSAIGAADVPGYSWVNWSWRISSEANYDLGTFYVDGEDLSSTVGSMSGTGGGLLNRQYNLPAGTHTIFWVYSKDVVNAIGDDCLMLNGVNFMSPPFFVTAPYTTNYWAGSTAYLYSDVGGWPAPALNWQRSGTNISGATAATLAITNLQASDQGQYTLVANNTHGTISNDPPLTLLVLSLPTIVTQPASQIFTAGYSATLSVVAANAFPPTLYQWRKNGANITGATSSAYTIGAVTTNDAASYTVAVSNSYGGLVSSAAVLTVYILPTITTQPSSQTVAMEGSVTFSVVAGGFPTPGLYYWKKDGTNIAGATGTSYTIPNVSTNDAGSYTVEVHNVAGAVLSSAAVLTVLGAPYITTQPASQTVLGAGNSIYTTVGGSAPAYANVLGPKPDNTASFSVGATGAPALLRYQWYLGGNALAGETNTTLVVAATHTGSYTVVVGGSVTSSVALLTVDQPAGRLAYAFDQAGWSSPDWQGVGNAFWANESAYAPISKRLGLTGNVAGQAGSCWYKPAQINPGQSWSFQWTFQGGYANGGGAADNCGFVIQSDGINDNVTGPGGATVSGITNQFLSIALDDYLNAGDPSASSLKVTYGTGSGSQTQFPFVNLATAFANANEAPGYSCVNGGFANPPYNLSASYLAASNRLTVTMANIKLASGATGSTNNPLIYNYTLNLASLFGTNAGTVGVNANVGGAAENHHILNFSGQANFVPVITSQPTSLVKYFGESASLTVAAASGLTNYASYQWYLGGVTIAGATNATYTAASITTSNAGSYTVVLTTSGGSLTSAVATLTVRVPPYFITPLAGRAIAVGGSTTFSANATGDAPLAYQWQFNGVNVSGATGSSLAITDARTSQNGQYKVIISNAYGTTNATASLSVLLAPLITLQPSSVTVREGGAATLSVAATGSPVLKYQWYHWVPYQGAVVVGPGLTALPGATNAVYALTSIQRDQLGWYQLQVANAVGTNSSRLVYISPAANEYTVTGWGDGTYGQSDMPLNWTNIVAVSAGGYHTLALTADGRVRATGDDSAQQCDVPFGLSNVVAIAAGAYHSLALLNDSTVVAWGDNSLGQSSVLAGLSNIVAIAAGTDHSLALTKDSAVVAWGANDAGQTTVPALATANVMTISAGNKISLARRYSGLGVKWGSDIGTIPNYTAQTVSAGNQHALFLLNDNTVGAAGINAYGQTNVPAGLANVTAIAAGGEHSLALKNDGTVVAWGAGDAGETDTWPDYGQATVPAGLAAVLAITAGSEHSAALSATPPVFLTQPAGQTVTVGDALALSASCRGSQIISYQWFNNGTAVAGATSAGLSFVSAALTNAGNYTLVASNFAGAGTSSVAVVKVVCPPFFLTQPAAVAVIQGSALSLAATLGGTGAGGAGDGGTALMSLQWVKDGAAIAGATSLTFGVAAVAATDAGAYQLIAQNSYGTVTSAVAQVSVVLAPQIVASPESQNVAVGVSFALVATVQGTEPLGYRWTKDGAALPGYTSTTLMVVEAALADAGAYRLIATNLYGSATSDVAQITVFAPPTLALTNSPATNRVASGQGLVLAVTNTGTGPFTYSWRLDGSPIAVTDTPMLTMTNLSVTNGGAYSVVIGNYAGQITVVLAQVTVTGPPVITQEPASVIAASGSTVLLTVTASGEAPLIYQWVKGGGAGGAGGEIGGATNSSLTLAAAALADAGVYTVLVANNAGAVTSAPALLQVGDFPVITVQPMDQALDVGEDFLLSVAATGSAPLVYQWFQDQESITGETNNSLYVYGVNAAAAGVYAVTVSNLVGGVVSRDTLVVVRAGPVIVTEPSSAWLALGASVTLGVQVFGNQPLAFQWFKDAVALAGATNSTLSISNLVAAHAGVYSVVVTNEFGAASGEILTLQLTGAPVITAHPENVLVVPGGSAVFRGTASGLGDLTYQWLKDGVAIAGATGPELSLSSVSTNDLGSYQLVVANAGGRTESEAATLAFHGLPSILTQPRDITVYTDETGELFVAVSSTLPFTCQWRRNGAVASGGTNLMVSSASANVADGDVYTVEVTSAVGAVASKPAQVHLRSRQATIASGGAYITQVLRLVPGWNSIYFDVQSDSNTVPQVMGDLPWSSVWSWRDRNRSVQYVQELSEATPDQTDWLVHYRTNRTESFNNNLSRIQSHRPYLVHIDGSNAVTLSVTGKAAYRPLAWVPDSYNLTGLPVESGAPNVRMFFQYSAAHYDAAAAQPRAMYELTADGQWHLMTAETALKRNTAYWIYCRGASDFNGGFDLRLPYGTSLNFGADVSLLNVDFVNSRPEPLTVTLSPFGSNTSWPLATRLLNFQGLQYPDLLVPYIFDLAGSNTFSLGLVPQRTRVYSDGFAGVLAAHDTRGTLHLVSVEIPRGEAASASPSPAPRGTGPAPSPRATGPSPSSPYTGLWMGYATLKAVSELNGLISVTNRVRTTNTLGEVANIVTLSYTNNPMTPAPTPVDADLDLRLIIHVDASGQARLLSEVFQLWQDGTTTNAPNGLKQDATPGRYVLITDRRLLDSFKGSSLRDGERVGRRLSSAVFAFDGPDAVLNYVTFTGDFSPGNRVTTSFGLASTGDVNPFRHKYNPHHDNLDASFKVFQEEAYTVTREVTLRFDALPPSKDPSAARNELAGVYSERVTGLHRKAVATSGDFRIRRLSRIDQLNPTPTP